MGVRMHHVARHGRAQVGQQDANEATTRLAIAEELTRRETH
jgi:hypothetical protein